MARCIQNGGVEKMKEGIKVRGGMCGRLKGKVRGTCTREKGIWVVGSCYIQVCTGVKNTQPVDPLTR